MATAKTNQGVDSALPAEGDWPDAADLRACLRVLERLRLNPSHADDQPELGRAVARAYKGVRKDRRRNKERRRRAADRAIVEVTGRCRQDGIRILQRSEGAGRATVSAVLASSDNKAILSKPRSCYICKSDYRCLDPFYHLLCPICAAENHARRSARADLAGRRALITGGRIKIGFQTALKLLRDGAEVIVTTRFPQDAALRYAAEADFGQWSDRLRVHGLDLRNLSEVYAFADRVSESFGSLDVLINNAAQTIRREPAYFTALYERERTPSGRLPPSVLRLLAPDMPPIADAGPPPSAADRLSTLPDFGSWPDDLPYDASGRPRDARPVNSWLLELPDIAPAELAEVLLVNAMAPFALCSRLGPLMRQSRFADRHVVNVSAMEGRFDRGTKTPRHPHTNMAKAALNMLTRTSASRLAEDGIFMNSVDTGWVTEENPHPKRARLRAGGFVPPLDEIDGAARVYDPIVRGVGGRPVFGQFLKDYRPVSW